MSIRIKFIAVWAVHILCNSQFGGFQTSNCNNPSPPLSPGRCNIYKHALIYSEVFRCWPLFRFSSGCERGLPLTCWTPRPQIDRSWRNLKHSICLTHIDSMKSNLKHSICLTQIDTDWHRLTHWQREERIYHLFNLPQHILTLFKQTEFNNRWTELTHF